MKTYNASTHIPHPGKSEFLTDAEKAVHEQYGCT